MEIAESVRQGLPVPVPVIDAHTHLGVCSVAGLHQAFRSVADTVSYMDYVGIDYIVTSSIIMEFGDMALANAQTAEAIRAFPGRIYGNLVICPHDGPEAVKDIIRTYGSTPGFVALKMLTGYHGSPDRVEYDYALSFAQECGCPVTFHYWNNNPSQKSVEAVLDRFPI